MLLSAAPMRGFPLRAELESHQCLGVLFFFSSSFPTYDKYSIIVISIRIVSLNLELFLNFIITAGLR